MRISGICGYRTDGVESQAKVALSSVAVLTQLHKAEYTLREAQFIYSFKAITQIPHGYKNKTGAI